MRKSRWFQKNDAIESRSEISVQQASEEMNHPEEEMIVIGDTGIDARSGPCTT